MIIKTICSVEWHFSAPPSCACCTGRPRPPGRRAIGPDCLTRGLCCHSSQARIFLRNAAKVKRRRVTNCCTRSLAQIEHNPPRCLNRISAGGGSLLPSFLGVGEPLGAKQAALKLQVGVFGHGGLELRQNILRR